MDDATGASAMIHLLGDVLELAVLLAARIKLAAFVLGALVALAVVVAVRRWRRNRRDR